MAILFFVMMVINLTLHTIVYQPREIENRQRYILYKIDHVQVLEACKFIMANRPIFHQDPEWHGLDPKDLSRPDPADSRMPAIIRAFDKISIFAGEDSVQIEFGGGFRHYGLKAYSGGVMGSGTREIIPHLWYYDENDKIPAP